MKHIKDKQELIKELIKIGVTGIDKPWEKMTMEERANYAIYINHKRAKDVDVAKIKSMDDRAYFISHFPKSANRYDINTFGDYTLSRLVIARAPSLLRKVDKKRISKLEWSSILPHQPQFAKYCDFSTLLASDWAVLLMFQPQFVDRFDATRFKDVQDWYFLLKGCPALWRKCPFDSFSREGKLKIASVSVQLLKKLDLKALTRKDWLAVMGCHVSKSESTKIWMASEFKRLSSQLMLPR